MIYTYDDVVHEVEKGKRGENKGLTMGLPKFDTITLGVQKKRYDILFGNEGTGKSALALNSYICNPIIQSIRNNIDLKVMYFSLEVSAAEVITKISSWIMYNELDVLTSPKTLTSKGEHSISAKIETQLASAKDMINKVLSRLDIIDDPKTPSQIKEYVLNFAKKRGVLKVNGDTISYTPNNPNEHIILVIDTLSNLSLESVGNSYSTKTTIDLHSTNCRYIYRNKLSYSVCDVMHSNRSSTDTGRARYGSITPSRSDIMHSSVPSQNANIVMAIFNPLEYANDNNTMGNFLGYKIADLHDRYRALFLLKNRDGTCNKIVSTAFMGECGHFSELPASSSLTDADYKKIAYKLSL